MARRSPIDQQGISAISLASYRLRYFHLAGTDMK